MAEGARRGGLTPELAEAARQITAHARAFGLDFWEICFELLDYDELNEVVIAQGRLLKWLQAQQQQLSDTVQTAELERISSNNPKPPHH